MIAQVTGPPGAGKSYYSVRKASGALERGKFVVTNFAMTPGWIETCVRKHPRMKVMRWQRKKRLDKWSRNYLQVADMAELNRVRLGGEGESRGVVILDEAHRFLNSRQWNDEGRAGAVDFFTLHRKLGWDVYLITQDAANLDKQVRHLFEYHIKLKNLKRFRLLGVPIFPFNWFFAVWFWHGVKTPGVQKAVKRESYRLNWRAKLYNSMGIPGEEEAGPPENVIWLPAEPAAPRAGEKGVTTTRPGGAGGGSTAEQAMRRRWSSLAGRRRLLGLSGVAAGLLILQQNMGGSGAGLF